MTFAQFMALALYDPNVGYYRRPQKRIGYEPGTDFFTASTSGPVFGELITAACVSLLGEADPGVFHFIEIGAEPSPPTAVDATSGVLTGVTHPFATARTVGLGQPLELAGNCIVFSNELFDAQPFHRFVFRHGSWRELGVALQGDELAMTELTTRTPIALPETAEEGYLIDAPLAATGLIESIVSPRWTGLFVAVDYGKSWRELTEATPQGTARAYFRHTQSNRLLAHPGDQDLTCHICWDWLETALKKHGFSQTAVESQESFFVRRAGRYIARASAEDAAHFSQRKGSLAQLLLPAHLGQKFQVLHARRFG